MKQLITSKQNMVKKFLVFLPLFIFALFPIKVFAYTAETFVTITNPVRGPEDWKNLTQDPIDVPIALYEESSKAGLPSNWLLRYDTVTDATISAFFNGLIGPDKLVKLGGLLEITPKLAQKANINYPNGNTNRLFLSGYTQAQRLKLIDTFMDTFKSRFGFFPKFVGAWHIDSYSLEYLQHKYSVLTAMIIDDQYSADDTRLWGGYLGSPYFPNKNNSLTPADSLANRVNLAVVRWSQRDLFNTINPRGSFYSVQPDDYVRLGQSTTYFKNLLSLYSQKEFNQFTYLNIGLENNRNLKDYLPEIKNIYSVFKANKTQDTLHFVSLEDFGNWMISLYPESSPVFFYRTTDPTGNQSGEVVWYQTPSYRIGLKSADGQTKIIDFRAYNRQIYEDYFATPNQNTGVYAEIPAMVDSVKNPGTEIPLNINLQDFKTDYSSTDDIWKISLTSGDQKITFTENKIVFSNIIFFHNSLNDIRETKTSSDTIWTMLPHTPFTNIFSKPIFPLLITLVLIIICFVINKTFGLGSLIALIPLASVLKDNQLYPFGMGYWGSNAHDAIFHLSIIEKISQNPLDLSHPQLAGEKLSNYHFVFDYLSGLLVRLTHIPSYQIYFFVLPLAVALSLTFLIIKLLRTWKFSEREILLSIAFVFLAGSLGFIPSLLAGNGPFLGESAFWANQSISIFLNPPYALSLVVLLTTLLLVEKYKSKKSIGTFIPLVLLGGLLSQTKIYAFILLAGGLFFTGQWLVLLSIGLIGALFTLPFSTLHGFPFIFSPFWFVRSMFASSDRLNWLKVANAWQAYEATGSFAKLLLVNIFGTLIFLIGNIGTRLLGVFEIARKKNTFISQKILIFVALFGVLIPLIFTQQYNPWNSIQFIYYSLFVLGLFSGKGAISILKKIKSIYLKIILSILIVIFTGLTTVGSIMQHTGFWPSARVGYTELRALEYLRTIPKGVVLAPFFDGQSASAILPPKPLYAYASTAYISALSGQPEFLSDTINLDITGYNYQERAKDVQRFYNTIDIQWAKNFLLQNDIKYIYETPLKRLTISPDKLSLTKIYDSGEINIYQTK